MPEYYNKEQINAVHTDSNSSYCIGVTGTTQLLVEADCVTISGASLCVEGNLSGTTATLDAITATTIDNTTINTTDIVGTTAAFTTTSASTSSQTGKVIFGDPLKYIEGNVASTMIINGGGNSTIFRHTSNGWGRATPGNFGFEDSTFPSIASSAIVTITSTTKGLLIPRMTTTQKNAITAVAGLMVYDTTTNKHCGYNGTTWNDFY